MSDTMDVLGHWADGMPRRDLADEVETLRGRLRDADFRERGLHEALRRETAKTQGAVEALAMVPRGTPGCTCGTPPFAPPEPSDDCPYHRPQGQ